MRPVARLMGTAVAIVTLAGILSGGVQGQAVGPNFMVAVPPCGFEQDPVVAAQGSHVLVAWRGCNVDGNVRASASRDGGLSWQAAGGIPWEDTFYTPVAICAGDSGRFYVAAPTFRAPLSFP